MPSPPSFWNELFGPSMDQAPGFPVGMRLLRKRGRPLLLLPCEAGAAVACLDLYPAQSGRARIARGLLRVLLKMGLPFGTEKIAVSVLAESPFVEFVCSLGQGLGGGTRLRNEVVMGQSPAVSLSGVPTLGILAGNPANDTQRFLVLIFDAQQKPVAVVKTGLSERARELVRKESAFLASVPANTPGVPERLAVLETALADAFAMKFFAGDSPTAGQVAETRRLLSSWLDAEGKTAISETPAWPRLEAAARQHGPLRGVAERLSGRTVCAAIQHGDFAPWNIKVSPEGNWTVLDWERGQLKGIPAWDWFHYVIQSAILVGRAETSALVEHVEGLLATDAFQQYVQRTGIAGLERDLVLAYLLHVVEVIQPAEGLSANRELLDTLAAKWATHTKGGS